MDTASTLLAAMTGEGEESTLLGGAVDGHPIYVWTPEGKVSMQGAVLRLLLALPAPAAEVGSAQSLGSRQQKNGA